MLLKEFDDQIITQEILLLSFTIINDQAKEILSILLMKHFQKKLKNLERVKKL